MERRRLSTTLISLLFVATAFAGCLQEAPANDGSANGASTNGTLTDPPIIDIVIDEEEGTGECSPTTQTPPNAAWHAENPRAKFSTTSGDFIVELARERAPVTVGNFLDLTEAGYYDGVLFHRVIKDFMIQTGDALSKDADPANDGTGGPGYKIPDEFNPSLRHDQAGVLSMANSGPNSGGSQFFITLGPTPHLDDRHAVFGQVTSGMEVVTAIGATSTDTKDRPVEPITIKTITLVEADPICVAHGIGVHPVLDTKTGIPERDLTFSVILQNTGTLRDTITLRADAPEGWSATVNEAPTVNAATARVVFVTVTPPVGATGPFSIPLVATSAWEGVADATASVTVNVGDLGPAVKSGDKVQANYVGLLPDGRLFDTSVESVAKDQAQPKFKTTGGFQMRPSYSTFGFTVGAGVIAGFTNLALTAREGEVVTALIPARDAYASGNAYERPLTGRDLIFELEILSIG